MFQSSQQYQNYGYDHQHHEQHHSGNNDSRSGRFKFRWRSFPFHALVMYCGALVARHHIERDKYRRSMARSGDVQRGHPNAEPPYMGGGGSDWTATRKVIKHNDQVVECISAGTGSPTVVINADSTAMGLLLMFLVSKFTKCISYTHADYLYDAEKDKRESLWDPVLRPMLPWRDSDPRKHPNPAPSKRGASGTVSDSDSQELVAVLREMEVDDDVVLVSMNHNWMSTLKAAARNANGVAGVVMVNPMLPLAGPHKKLNTPLKDALQLLRGEPFGYLAQNRAPAEFTRGSDDVLAVQNITEEWIARTVLFEDLSSFTYMKLTSFCAMSITEYLRAHAAAWTLRYRQDPRMLAMRRRMESLRAEDEQLMAAAPPPAGPAKPSAALPRGFGLLAYVKREFGAGAKTPPPFPVSVLVPRLQQAALESPRQYRPLFFLPLTVEMKPDASEVELRKQFTRHSEALGSLWSRVMPNRVKWTHTSTKPQHEPFMVSMAAVSKEIQAVVSAHRSQKFGMKPDHSSSSNNNNVTKTK